MCRLLGIPETESPAADITPLYAILNENWETQMRSDLDKIQAELYNQLVSVAQQSLGIESGRNKPLVARFVAEQLAERKMMPEFVSQIVTHLKAKLGLDNTSEAHKGGHNSARPWDIQSDEDGKIDDDELPF